VKTSQFFRIALLIIIQKNIVGFKELTHKSLFVSETFLTYKTPKLHHQCHYEVV